MLVFALGQADSSCLPPVAPNLYTDTIEMMKHPAKTPPEFVRSARNSLAAAPADALPSFLAATHEQPLPVVNWLRYAGDDIVDRNLREVTALPHGNLADIAGDRAISPHPRRITLEWCERTQRGFTAEFLPDRLNEALNTVMTATRLHERIRNMNMVSSNRIPRPSLLGASFAPISAY